MPLINQTKNLTLAPIVHVASTFKERSKGLLGRKSLDQRECLWIGNCPMVHTFFMKFTIDVIFVNSKGKVTQVCEDLKPWRMTFPKLGNSSVYEFAAGSINGKVNIGDEIYVKP